MSKYVDAEKLKEKIQPLYEDAKKHAHFASQTGTSSDCAKYDKAKSIYEHILWLINSLQQEQPDEQPEYGYLSTKYVHGKKSRWNVGDVLAYYICTSNEEGECLLGKIVNVQFDEDWWWWVYTFEDESTWDEQSLIEEGAYKKN